MSARELLLSMFVASCAAAGVTGSASGEHATHVGFAVRGNPAAAVTTSTGKTVSFVARATVRSGDRLQILVRRGTAVARRVVASCALSPCPGNWAERTGITDRFQAVLTRGGAVAGRSRTVGVTWKSAPPAPTPAPAPTATPGHYEGRTSQNEIFRFDITSDGRGLVNLTTGQINESCTGSDGERANLSHGNIGPVSQTLPVNADGTFTISAEGPTSADGNPATYKTVITGRVQSGIAGGTLRDDTTYQTSRTTFTCSSGDQTWTATKTG